MSSAQTVTAEIKRYNTGIPQGWITWGKGEVSPGQDKTLGSGMGPFFEVTGIAGGAVIIHGTALDVTLKVNGTSSIQFELTGNEAGRYMALVY